VLHDVSHDDVRKRIDDLDDQKAGGDRTGGEACLLRVEIGELSHEAAHCIE